MNVAVTLQVQNSGIWFDLLPIQVKPWCVSVLHMFGVGKHERKTSKERILKFFLIPAACVNKELIESDLPVSICPSPLCLWLFVSFFPPSVSEVHRKVRQSRPRHPPCVPGRSRFLVPGVWIRQEGKRRGDGNKRRLRRVRNSFWNLGPESGCLKSTERRLQTSRVRSEFSSSNVDFN